MHSDILIIGGGLSGLRLASLLAERGVDFRLLEARDRFGGRIMTDTTGGRYFDLGPAWFWPGQPRIADLVQRLNLSRFDQFSDGALTFEDESGSVQHGRGFASMEGSYRLDGGLSTLIDALSDGVPKDRLLLGQTVQRLDLTDDGVSVLCEAGQRYTANRVVLALPPRIASKLAFNPALPAKAVQTLQGIATWMAGQAKAIALYDTPFWREAGLSGDAMSRHGPMVEIHDASPREGGPFALFGFIGVPPTARQNEEALRDAIRMQLVRLFGDAASSPKHLLLKDWAFDPFTSMSLDHQPLFSHPHYGRPQLLSDLWNGRLVFSGTEMASQFGGYLEGALEAAEDANAILQNEYSVTIDDN